MSKQSSKENKMRWICSEGGPLLLLDNKILNKWGGVIDPIEGTRKEESYSPIGKRTDYDRACHINEFLGKIPVGNEEAIVLSGEPLVTAWISLGVEAGGMLVRCVFAESEMEFLDWIGKIPDTIFRPEFLFYVEGPLILLFDSAVAGRNVKKRPEDYLSIELEPGPYEIKTAIYQPDSRTSMVVHKLVPKGLVD